MNASWEECKLYQHPQEIDWQKRETIEVLLSLCMVLLPVDHFLEDPLRSNLGITRFVCCKARSS
jgi:hypothetical protein